MSAPEAAEPHVHEWWGHEARAGVEGDGHTHSMCCCGAERRAGMLAGMRSCLLIETREVDGSASYERACDRWPRCGCGTRLGIVAA